MSPLLLVILILGLTQAPTLIKDNLPSYGISIKNIKKWNREYNYESILCIYKYKF
jgi:hypothetical protein